MTTDKVCTRSKVKLSNLKKDKNDKDECVDICATSEPGRVETQKDEEMTLTFAFCKKKLRL